MDTLTLAAGDSTAIVFGVGGAIAIVAIVFSTVGKVLRTRQREMTKREIAAYVAEGSMTPQDAERILRAREPENK